LFLVAGCLVAEIVAEGKKEVAVAGVACESYPFVLRSNLTQLVTSNLLTQLVFLFQRLV
jgi:hypothetical protein